MGNSVILKIGSTDLTGYTIAGQVKIDKTPVWSDTTFKAVTGKEHKTYLGCRVQLSASFENLTASQAAAIQTACAASSVSITYLDPTPVTAYFDRPSVSAAVEWEDNGHNQYWSLSFQAVCPLLGDGL
jgi:hypothetical protein